MPPEEAQAGLRSVLVGLVVLGLHPVERVDLARGELERSGLLVRHDEEHQLVEIREPLPARVHAEIIGIGLEHRLLVLHELLEPPAAARHQALGGGGHRVGRREPEADLRMTDLVGKFFHQPSGNRQCIGSASALQQ